MDFLDSHSMFTQHKTGAVWQRELTRLFPETEITVHDPFPGGSMGFHVLAGGWLLDVSGGRQEVVRRGIRGGWSDFVSIMFQVEGCSEMEHAGRVCRLEPGSVALIDGTLGSTLQLAGLHRQQLLLVPRSSLALEPEAFGVCLRPDDGVDRLLVEHLRYFGAAAPRSDVAVQRALLGSLLTLFGATSLARRSRETTRFCVRAERAIAYIARRYPDPELTAAHVAEAQGIGRRHLDALLSEHGTTLEKLIWKQRLESAARLLREQRSRNALQIALDCGFRDASHFSRKFRRHFGVTPTRYRALEM